MARWGAGDKKILTKHLPCYTRLRPSSPFLSFPWFSMLNEKKKKKERKKDYKP